MTRCLVGIVCLLSLEACASKGDGAWTPGGAGGESNSPTPNAGRTGRPIIGPDDPPDPTNGGRGGTAGRGGAPARGGSTARGGTSGIAGSVGIGGTTGIPPVTEPKLGIACTLDSLCGGNLKCVLPTDTVLGGGPPHGMCSRSCTANSECQAVDSNALCVVGAGDVGYCFQGCEYGVPASITDKCQGRLDFACTPVGEDAASAVPLCQPACGGDLDCPSGRVCNPASGLCVVGPLSGKNIGEACDPTVTPTTCKGLCVKNGSGVGTCTETCALGAPCQRHSDVPGGACLIGVSLIENESVGDLGLCAQTCNSSAECRGADYKCIAFDETSAQLYAAKGMCYVPAVDDTIL